MRILLLKTWRDISARKGQFIALIVLVALGITSYVAFISGYEDLKTSTKETYARLKFADFTVQVLNAPASVVPKIEKVPGVAAVQGRLVVDTLLDLSDKEQSTVRIIGLPPNRRPAVDDVVLIEGSYVGEGRNEGVLHNKYAIDAGKDVGELVTIRVFGQKRNVRVIGLATSPEYLFLVQSKGQVAAPREFGVLFMSQREVERLFRRPSSYTSIAVRVRPGASQARVIKQVEKILDPYDIVETVRQPDQPSNFSLQEEIKQNESIAVFMPMLILTISALSLAIALSRLVQSQRGEIGLAKALGYRDWQILVHYLLFSLFIAVAGSVIGFVLGDLAGRGDTALYANILGIPFLKHEIHASVVIGAILLSTISCLLAGLVPAFRSARMPPARAMHADPNLVLAGGKMPLVERLLGWALPQGFTFKLPLRNVFRAKRRSIYTIVGIAFALVLTVTTWSMFDSMFYMIDYQFGKAERWDVLAVFEENFYPDRPREMAQWNGVKSAQPALMLPVKITARGRKHTGLVTAMDPGATFHGFEASDGSEIIDTLQRGGLVLTPPVADKLGVKVGDTVAVDTPYIDEDRLLRVSALSDEMWGAPMFVGIEEGRKLAGSTERVYNVLYLNVNSRDAEAIKQRLRDIPGVLSVQVKGSILRLIDEYMALSYAFGFILLAFGWAMAFVVIYNTFTANILERTREIATMRTIGEDRSHLAAMVTIENLLLAVAGLPLGIWLGVRAAQALYSSMSTEAYSLKAIIFPMSVVYVTASIVIVLLLSEIPPIRRIFRLDLAEATKVME